MRFHRAARCLGQFAVDEVIQHAAKVSGLEATKEIAFERLCARPPGYSFSMPRSGGPLVFLSVSVGISYDGVYVVSVIRIWSYWGTTPFFDSGDGGPGAKQN